MIYILDFNGTLINNMGFPRRINKERVISRSELSKKLRMRINNNILLTGSHIRNKKEILAILEDRGYIFKKTLFREFSVGNPLTIRRRYINWKIREIQKIMKGTEGNIIVIDNDKGIIKKCTELGINCIEFDISKMYKAKNIVGN